MKGVQISLTGQEREILLNVLQDYIELCSNWSFERSEQLDEEMNNGLGRVMFKLHKGLIGEKTYDKYNKIGEI